jgi:general secretion pathway protein J
MRVRGFTLIEMLVALAVFAVLGVMASQLLARLVDVHDVASSRGQRLSDVQRAMQIMQRDIMQMSQRGVRDELGDPLVHLRLGGDVAVEFTRRGWRNPLGQRRSELQRVAYLVTDGVLYRYYWNVLDRAQDSQPIVQELLSDVEILQISAVDASGNEHEFWPLIGEVATDERARLVGIRVLLETTPFGEITRLWDVPHGYTPLERPPS